MRLGGKKLHSIGTDNHKGDGLVELFDTLEKYEGSYGFYFQEQLSSDHVSIKDIGREKRTSPDYYWDGLKREDDNKIIFQYTLSGFGMLELGKRVYQLDPGKAFIVKVPSEHRYYLPAHSKKWDFVFIALQGAPAEKCWEFSNEMVGPVFQVPPDSKLIQLLLTTYQETRERRITDAYRASAKGYEFMMELYRFADKLEKTKEIPTAIAQAVTFIQANFYQTITLDDIANVSSRSKYYLIKQFDEHLNTTPMQFLTQTRIKHAVELLLHTNLPIKEIAVKVGFSNDNYFNKVFRKQVGKSAGAFRKCKRGKYIIFN